jgi:hypothetical protein
MAGAIGSDQARLHAADVQLMSFTEPPTEKEAKHIKAQCERLQSEMLMFSRAGDFEVPDGVRTCAS